MLDNAQMADALDECLDYVSGTRSILVALGRGSDEEQALRLLAADLDRVAAKIETVRDELELQENAG